MQEKRKYFLHKSKKIEYSDWYLIKQSFKGCETDMPFFNGGLLEITFTVPYSWDSTGLKNKQISKKMSFSKNDL